MRRLNGTWLQGKGTERFRSRLGLAWAALRGELRGGLYISPRDLTKAEVHIEWCEIEGRVGKHVSLLEFSPQWKDLKPKEED
jgi:hypothetical protein